MNKLKKIGLTALAGTLASVTAAQAGAVSVNGTAEVSWVNLPEHKVTGQQLGTKKNISFSGSGEFANGWTFGIFHSMNDTFTGQSSSSMNLSMGGIASLAYDSGTGGYGANAVDNVVPTAWEEIDYGASTGLTDVGVVTKAHGVVNFTVTAPGSGTSLSLSYAPRMGAGAVADGGTSGAATSSGHNGIDARLDLWNVNTTWFDIRTGVAAEKVNHPNSCKNQINTNGDVAVSSCVQKGDAYAGTIYQTLGIGPLHAGLQVTYKDPGTAGGIENNKAWVAGVALVIGDYISLSCGRGGDEYYYSDEFEPETLGYDDVGGKGDDKSSATYRGCSAAGNWGPLALKFTKNSVDNVGGRPNSLQSHGNSQEHSEINLSMAF